MKKIVLMLATAVLSFTALAQPQGGFWGPRQETIKVWPDGAPNAFTYDVSKDPHGDQYQEAILEIYPAREPNGRCVIICPGGGYAVLSMTHEGRDIRQWLNARGFTCCLLQYRMPRGHHDVPLSDVQQAMRIMRGRTDLGITHIGVMGFSAGGHLASTASTHYVDAATRPDFQILFYPVITFNESETHAGSRQNLIGANPTQATVEHFCLEKQITPQTPPAFIMHSADDKVVPLANSLHYSQALADKGVFHSLHVYPVGGHGWAFHDWFPYKSQWTAELSHWLQQLQLRIR